jgi:thioredoxin reductase
MTDRAEDVVVVVVGGGPAGLACAVELSRRGVDRVVVLDREAEAGGTPRHSAHQGFGLRDLHRPLSGPSYARRYVRLARASGARVHEEAMVTDWSRDGGLTVTCPEGRVALSASAVVLATGCRERPRSARLVPGSRPAGVLTTGMLQQLAVNGAPVGTRTLVVGAEHVSFSALLTLAHAGVEVVGMVTEHPRHQTFGVFRAGAALRYRTPLWTRTSVTGIYGRPRVEEVELLDLDAGAMRRVSCDTVVFTANWIPDNELAATGGLELDAGTRGPRVDAGLRTTRPGVFAAGNLLHGAEAADVAALSGRHAAASVARWLAERSWPERTIPIVCSPPLLWVSPNGFSVGGDHPPRERFLLRPASFVDNAQVEIRQDDRLLWSGPVRRLSPGRSRPLPCAWMAQVRPAGGQIEVGLARRAIDSS